MASLKHHGLKRQRTNRNDWHHQNCQLESLEERSLLTTTLYMDFGDLFAAGGFTGTLGTLQTATNSGDPSVAGPDLSDPSLLTEDSDGFTMRSLATIYNNSNANYAGGLNQLRTDIVDLVNRHFEPFDIDVVDLTASAINIAGESVQAANSLLDISSTLGANESEPKNNDAYVIVGNLTIHRPVARGGDLDPSSVLGGIANGLDFNSANANDNTALMTLRPSNFDDFWTAPDAYIRGFIAYTISHEAGHLLGLQHALTKSSTDPSVSELLHSSEIMSYVPGFHENSEMGTFNVPFFSRFPMARGDDNTSDNDDLASIPHSFGRFQNDTQIGLNTDIHYVTGTGAHDIITLSKISSDTIRVSISPFSDSSYTSALSVPGEDPDIFTYTYDLVGLDRTLLIDAGASDDRITIEGDLGVSVRVRGMDGTDTLWIEGQQASNALYVTGDNSTSGLDGNLDLQGYVEFANTTIDLEEFTAAGNVVIESVKTLTVRTGGTFDILEFGTNLTTNRYRIFDPRDPMNTPIEMVPLEFADVSNLIIDTASNDTPTVDADNVRLVSPLILPALQNVTITTGDGNDVFEIVSVIDYRLPVSGGAFEFNGGSGDDAIIGSGDTSYQLSDSELSTSVNVNSKVLLDSVESARLVGGDSSNKFTVADWSGAAELYGLNGDDSYEYFLNGTGSGLVAVSDSGDGVDDITVTGTTKIDDVTVTNNSVTRGNEVLTYTAFEEYLTVNTKGGNDIINVESTAATMIETTIDGASGADRFGVAGPGNKDDELGNLNTIEGKLVIRAGDNHPADATSRDELVLHDKNGVELFDYRIEPYSVTNLVNTVAPPRTFAGVYFDETLEYVRVNGTEAVNKFSVRPSPNTIFHVDGNEPCVGDCTLGGGDFLQLDLDPLPPVDPEEVTNPQVTFTEIDSEGRQRAGVWTFDVPHQNVEFESIERFNLLDKVLVSDDAGANSVPEIDVRSATTLTSFSSIVQNFSPGAIQAFSIADFGQAQPSGFTYFTQLALQAADVNDDFIVDEQDVLIVLANLRLKPGQFDVRADINRDGKVTKLDLLAILDRQGEEILLAPVVGGVRTIAADLNCDGIDDIIAVSGANHAPTVQAFNGVTGAAMTAPQQIGNSDNRFGVYVAAGDFDGDGHIELTTSMERESELVSVWEFVDDHFEFSHDFSSGFGNGASSGVRVSAGDIDGDLIDEIIVSPGTGRDPEIRIFDGQGIQLRHIVVSSDYGRGGLTTVAADLNGDGMDEILILAGRRGGSLVSFVSGVAPVTTDVPTTLLNALFTTPDNLSPLSGVGRDMDGDGDDEFFVGQLSDGRLGKVQVFDWDETVQELFLLDEFDTDLGWTGDFLG